MQADVLVFSRDRPAQLELLLRSVERYAPELYSWLTVLAVASSFDYEHAYFRVGREYLDVSWRWQSDFEADVREWLGVAGETVSFLCDDDVFYRDAPALERLPFSLRGGDGWYPFSLDGNVYRREWVADLLDGLAFADPTGLEHQGHLHRGLLPFEQVYIADPPCLVGVPWNRVSPSSGMPHAGHDPAEMNRRFLGGDRLALPLLEPQRRLPAHAHLPLRWEAGVAA